MLGEYGDHIRDGEIILKTQFVDKFENEKDVAKLQILTACVKMYLKLPTKCEELVLEVLKSSNEQVRCTELKDRAYMYWKMMSTDPHKAYEALCYQKPVTSKQQFRIFDETLVDSMINRLGGVKNLDFPAGKAQNGKGDDNHLGSSIWNTGATQQ